MEKIAMEVLASLIVAKYYLLKGTCKNAFNLAVEQIRYEYSPESKPSKFLGEFSHSNSIIKKNGLIKMITHEIFSGKDEISVSNFVKEYYNNKKLEELAEEERLTNKRLGEEAAEYHFKTAGGQFYDPSFMKDVLNPIEFEKYFGAAS